MVVLLQRCLGDVLTALGSLLRALRVAVGVELADGVLATAVYLELRYPLRVVHR
jgi:hypothetical protein